LDSKHRARAAAFVDEFYEVIDSPARRQTEILDECRQRS
jgi:hypothetical protein